MQPHEQEQKFTRRRSKASQPRFLIERLEERIAPSHRLGHDPPGHHWNDYSYKTPPGHNCHRGCNQ